jgi:hypothetical protein
VELDCRSAVAQALWHRSALLVRGRRFLEICPAPQFQDTPSGNLTFTGTPFTLDSWLGGFLFMTAISRCRVKIVAGIAFAMILGAMIPPTTGLTHQVVDILLDLVMAGTGASFLFFPQQYGSGTPEQIVQRWRRYMLGGAFCVTSGLVMVAKDIAEFL